MKINTIIIGSGLAGIVMAERFARIKNENVFIIEQRNHIGGNCYDCFDERGILIQPYGPHIFHTDNKTVWNYLSNFTEWHHYQHCVLANIDNKNVPIPFNLNTLHAFVPEAIAVRIEAKLISQFGFGSRLSIDELLKSEDQDLQFIAGMVLEKIFLNYSVKQWGIKAEEISPDVLNRLPVVISKDDRYFHDIYQGLPKYGYTRMFKKMLDHPNIKILLNTSMKELIQIDDDTCKIRFMGNRFNGKLIFTGMIDELFNYKYGELPYRSLKFDHKVIDQLYFQENSVINYPNNYDFTRITEFKHMTGQQHNKTSILYEYPCQYRKDDPSKDIPCYPILTSENQIILENYLDLIRKFDNIIPLGRLAEYKYYDMDDMVERALDVFENKIEPLPVKK